MVRPTGKQQNGGYFVNHWKTEQTPAIRILNVFVIPALNVLPVPFLKQVSQFATLADYTPSCTEWIDRLICAMTSSENEFEKGRENQKLRPNLNDIWTQQLLILQLLKL